VTPAALIGARALMAPITAADGPERAALVGKLKRAVGAHLAPLGASTRS
jgi:hypothetical protein